MVPNAPAPRLDQRALLRLRLRAPLEISHLTYALRGLDSAYASLFFSYSRVDLALRLAGEARLDPLVHALRQLAPANEEEESPRYWPWWSLYPLPTAQPLKLIRIRAGSPGFADLGGAAGPLETARKYRIDHDERRKDRDWREDLDRERQEIENDLLRQERDRAEIEIEAARTHALHERFELLCTILGLDEARALVAREITEANRAMDAAMIGPRPELVSADEPEPADPEA
jgi:hypothetical protein